MKLKTEKRKIKNITEPDENSQNENGKPTREERMHIQKIKNRESAQRSRDQRKTYILKLEQENCELRTDRDRLLRENNILAQNRFCSRCMIPLQEPICDILEQ
jgi:hypothetical protein